MYANIASIGKKRLVNYICIIFVLLLYYTYNIYCIVYCIFHHVWRTLHYYVAISYVCMYVYILFMLSA